MNSISNDGSHPVQRPRTGSYDQTSKPEDVKTIRVRTNNLPGRLEPLTSALQAKLEESPLALLKKQGVTQADLEDLPNGLKNAAASVQTSAVSTQIKSTVKALQAGLNKLWQAVVAPVLAALATGGLFIYNIIKTSIKAAFLPVVCLTKLFIAICSKISGKDFSNAQKITTKFIAKTLTEFVYALDLKRNFEALDKSLKSGSSEEILKYFDLVKRDVEAVASYASMNGEEYDNYWQRNR
ncbi:MAG: hypothetical protein WCN87_01790 [Chlamydiota bacterium]